MIEYNFENYSVEEAVSCIMENLEVTTIRMSKQSFIYLMNSLGNIGPNNPAIKVLDAWSFPLRRFNREVGFRSIKIQADPTIDDSPECMGLNLNNEIIVKAKLCC